MNLAKILIAGIALLIGSWLAFDGVRALLTGDYTTAKSGPHAGQLGPWSRIVSVFGINPRSQTMKITHVALGAIWLVAELCFVLAPSLGWWALLVSSILSLWYLPVGTVLSVIELCLLLLPQIRNLR